MASACSPHWLSSRAASASACDRAVPRRQRPPWRPRSATAPRAPSRQVARARDVPGLTASSATLPSRRRGAHASAASPSRRRRPSPPPPPPRERRRRSGGSPPPPPASSRGRAPGTTESQPAARRRKRPRLEPAAQRRRGGPSQARARTGGAHARDAAGDGEPACVWKRVGSACLRAISSCVRVSAAGDGGRRVRRACAGSGGHAGSEGSQRSEMCRAANRRAEGTRESGGNTGPRPGAVLPAESAEPGRCIVGRGARSSHCGASATVRKEAMTSSVFDDTTKTPLSVCCCFPRGIAPFRERATVSPARAPRSRIASHENHGDG